MNALRCAIEPLTVRRAIIFPEGDSTLTVAARGYFFRSRCAPAGRRFTRFQARKRGLLHRLVLIAAKSTVRAGDGKVRMLAKPMLGPS